MLLGEHLRKARKNAGLTQRELALAVDARHNSVSNWENGLNTPDPLTLRQLCEVLGITPNYLFFGDESAHAVSAPIQRTAPLAPEERELLDAYRSLDAAGRGAVSALIRYYSAQPSHAQHVLFPFAAPAASVETQTVRARISLQSVAAGTGTWLDEEAFEEIALIENDLTRRAHFLVPVSGDSMEPKFHDGDILIVADSQAHPGEIGVFTLDNLGYVKRCGVSELLSLNPAYAPIPMSEDILCNGKVIGILDPSWIVSQH